MSDHMIITIAHTELRPDEPERTVQLLDRIFEMQKRKWKKSRENPKSDWNQFEIEIIFESI